MALSALEKFFLPPAIASVAVFSAMTVPLGMVGDKLIDIRLEQEPFFSGRVREGAISYVIGATAISIGAGISVAALCGWRHSSRKSAKFEQYVSALEKNLQEKELLLSEFKQSETRLQNTGLKGFLDEEIPFEAAVSANTFPQPISQPVVAQTPAPIYEPVTVNTHSSSTKEDARHPVTSVTAASAFASAQTFLGYVPKHTNNDQEVTVNKEANKTPVNPAEFEELQKQLRDMMLHMQAMEKNLQLTPQVKSAEPKSAEKFSVYYENPNAEALMIR